MILFYGRTDDSPLARALEEARAAGADHRVIDQTALAGHNLSLRVSDEGLDGAITVAGEWIPLDAISAVYARPLEPTGHLADASDGQRTRRLHEAVIQWLDVADALVVNRPAAMASNGSKPFQLQLIAAAGLEVPATLVTSDPDEVASFQREHGRVIYKSVSGIRSIVRELDDVASHNLARVRDLPTQFQAFVPGVDLRVHVVGRACFATEIRSSAVDYRYARRDGTDAVLRAVPLSSDDEAERCCALARHLGLSLCGIDLRRRPDGGLVCFEVNPMPAYSYYEAETGQPIGRALIELLASAPRDAPRYAPASGH